MHSAAFFHILTVLVFILVSASSTTIDLSDTADSPTARGAVRFKYKRRSFTGPTVTAATAQLRLVHCHGNLPTDRVVGNTQAFASLTDWCLRGPAQCTCDYQASSQMYEVRCAMNDNLLDMVPEIVACYNQCYCGNPTNRARLEGLANAALLLGRVRAGVV